MKLRLQQRNFVEIDNVIIQGGGGHAKVVADCLLAQGKKVLGFVDSKNAGSLLGISQYKISAEPALHIIAIGDNRIRKKISLELVGDFINAIHPSVIISTFAQIGAGNMILHRAVIQASSSLGNHIIINTGAQIDHDCIINDYVHIAPRGVLCGNVSVGEGALVGAGAIITPGKKIGAWAIVGAGAIVISDVPDFAVVVGNPARIIKYNSI